MGIQLYHSVQLLDLRNIYFDNLFEGITYFHRRVFVKKIVPMTATEKIEQAITNFVRGGDNSDTVLLDKVLHKDFRVTNNGFMGTSGVTLIDKQKYLSNIRDGIFGGL